MLVFLQRAGCETFSLEVEETSTVASLVEAAARALDTEADSIVLHYGADAAPLLEVTALEEGCTVVVEASPRVVAEAELRRRGCEVSEEGVRDLVVGDMMVKPHDNMAELLPLYIETKCAPQQALYAAAVGDDVASMRRLIAEGADINETCDGYSTIALVYAAMVGSVGCVRLALEEGADPDATMKCLDFRGFTAAMGAANAGSVECLQVLIEAGCNVAMHADYGDTALSDAASHGYADCMQLLLDAGDHTPNATFGYSCHTLLMLAAGSGDPECLRLAFKADAPNLTQTCDGGMTAEDLARGAGHSEAFAAALEAYNAAKQTKKRKREDSD